VITLADVFAEIEQSLRVVGEPGSRNLLRDCWNEHVSGAPSLKALQANLVPLIRRITDIPHASPANCPKVVVTGDFFTRLNPAFLGAAHDLYAQHGIILIPANLDELLLYDTYAAMASAAREWEVPAGSLRATALACMKILQPAGRDYLMNWLKYHRLRHYEEHYRRLFRPTGLLVGGASDMRSLFRHASQHISPTIFGEAVPTVGKGVAARGEGYQGIIVIGPFNCLPLRISEAILKPFGLRERIPILTYESDGFSVSPAFLRQVDVHIQQVLDSRPAEHKPPSPSGGSER
jgi:hypothetical protein